MPMSFAEAFSRIFKAITGSVVGVDHLSSVDSNWPLPGSDPLWLLFPAGFLPFGVLDFLRREAMAAASCRCDQWSWLKTCALSPKVGRTNLEPVVKHLRFGSQARLEERSFDTAIQVWTSEHVIKFSQLQPNLQRCRSHLAKWPLYRCTMMRHDAPYLDTISRMAALIQKGVRGRIMQ